MDVTRDPARTPAAPRTAGRTRGGRGRVRLVCLPQAGGGTGAFDRWRGHVPDAFDLVPVAYPRDGAAPAPGGLPGLAAALLAGLGLSRQEPFALFGHGFGGTLAYEMACHLGERGGPTPLAVLACGSRAPHVPPGRRLAGLDDRALVDWLVDHGGLPLELLKHTEFLGSTVGAIRADLTLAEGYLRPDPVRLGCPLHVFGGIADRVTPCDTLNDWRMCAAGEFSATVLPGGHAFPHTDPAVMLASVAAMLPELPVAGAPDGPNGHPGGWS